jgi:acetylornithine deacetylase/succinyl-diaminopimelate desuccinylase-like protein
VTVDQIGNIFMRREGTNPKLPPVMTGSRVDTQPTGGKFDGNYGVLAIVIEFRHELAATDSHAAEPLIAHDVIHLAPFTGRNPGQSITLAPEYDARLPRQDKTNRLV